MHIPLTWGWILEGRGRVSGEGGGGSSTWLPLARNLGGLREKWEGKHWMQIDPSNPTQLEVLK